MALIPIDRVVNTLLIWLKLEEPVLNSIVDTFFPGRQITFFEAIRKTIPESSLPSIEVGPTGDTGEWPFVRVQGDKIELEVHITVSNLHPEEGLRLESRLASYVDRILRFPPHLRGRIEGTNIHFQDSYTKGWTYGAANYAWNIRVTKTVWEGSVLEYLSDKSFPTIIAEGGDHWPGLTYP